MAISWGEPTCNGRMFWHLILTDACNLSCSYCRGKAFWPHEEPGRPCTYDPNLPAELAIDLDDLAAFLRQVPARRHACALVDVSDLMQCEPGPWAQLCTAARAMPIVALSPDDDAATRQMARAMGAQAFFRKPVDAAALLDSIDWVMCAEARDASAGGG